MATQKTQSVYAVTFVGMMAAVVFVSNFFSIPTAASRIHIANAVCLLGGRLFGGVYGGLAAAIGSGLFDIVGGWGLTEAVITFINKGLMALVCGLIVYRASGLQGKKSRLFIGAIAGAVLYIALYLLKSYVQLTYVTPVPPETIPALMVQKLLASSINGAFAVIAAPLLYGAIRPAMEQAGMYEGFIAR
ncbi:MAG: ECF transporter S component [Clostridiales bacterium]|nr:ECF transporter S component [Clostridiales bacterium]